MKRDKTNSNINTNLNKCINKGKTKRIKKLIAASLITVLSFSLLGCGDTFSYKYGRGLYQLDNMQKADDTIPGLAPGSSEDDYASSSDPLNPQLPSGGIVNYADEDNEEFEALMKDYFKKAVTSDSLSYHYTIKDGSTYGIEAPKATLGDASADDAAVAKQKKEEEEFYKKLTSFENEPLTKEERFTYECMKTEYGITLHMFDNKYFYEPFSPMRGVQANLPTNFTDFRFDNKSDVELYINLMNQMKEYFDTLIKFEYEKSDAGYFMADEVADVVIKQCDDFIADKENHFLIQTFDDAIDGLDFLTAEEKESFKESDREAVINSAIPAFEDLKKAIKELKGTATNDKGICNYEGGKDYYADYLFPIFSGSSKTVSEEIQLMDERQKNKILELSVLAASNSEAYEYFTKNYGTLYKKYDNMKASELVDYIFDNCMEDFPDLDKINYKAKYLSKPLETIMDGVLAYYMSPPIDDEDNNLIYVNGAHPTDMWVTLAHEGCPGHMYQNNYFQSTNPSPVRAIQSNLGYMEGWAVYSSYSTLDKCDFGGSEYASTLAKISQINSDLGYLLYGRIDMGVNYEGWSREDTKNYLVKSGYSSDAADEVYTTIIGDPGVYLSYSVSYYEMEELRKYAEEQLGSKFDVKEYHKAILSCGPCQFSNLKTVVDEYILENR